MEQVQIRTDLALEARESVSEKEEHLHGVQVEEEYKEESEIRITRVTIGSKNGARLLGKAMGTYVTLEAPNMAHPDEDYHEEIARELADQIKSLLPKKKEQLSILIVGLGNREVTADSLGPRVVDNLTITRHMVMEFGNAAYEGRKLPLTSSLVPGVMAKTGMESQEIISGVVTQTHPDLVLVIDALAARSIKRLNRTIQISNAGLIPVPESEITGMPFRRKTWVYRSLPSACPRWWTLQPLYRTLFLRTVVWRTRIFLTGKKR